MTTTDTQQPPFYLRSNDTEECWELLERGAIRDEGKAEDALLARLYDGNATGSPLGSKVASTLNDERASPIRAGIISISFSVIQYLDIPQLALDCCDTQGQLRERGVFEALKQRLFLPASYTIDAIFCDALHRVWKVAVSSPDLPPVGEECGELPAIEPRYWREDNGTIGLIDLVVWQHKSGLSLNERLKAL